MEHLVVKCQAYLFIELSDYLDFVFDDLDSTLPLFPPFLFSPSYIIHLIHHSNRSVVRSQTEQRSTCMIYVQSNV